MRLLSRRWQAICVRTTSYPHTNFSLDFRCFYSVRQLIQRVLIGGANLVVGSENHGNKAKVSVWAYSLYQNVYELKRCERNGKLYEDPLGCAARPLLDPAADADGADPETGRNDRVSRLYQGVARRISARLSSAAPFHSNANALDRC